jgi:hypothetical protein
MQPLLITHLQPILPHDIDTAPVHSAIPTTPLHLSHRKIRHRSNPSALSYIPLDSHLLLLGLSSDREVVPAAVHPPWGTAQQKSRDLPLQLDITAAIRMQVRHGTRDQRASRQTRILRAAVVEAAMTYHS